MSFKEVWTEFTAKSQPAFKFLATHQLYKFMDTMQAPLGFVEVLTLLRHRSDIRLTLFRHPSDTILTSV